MRYRSISVVSAVNPGMPSGGLIDDSKSAILEKLRPSGRVADFIVIDHRTAAADQTAQLESFLQRQAKSFPVVLKPDFGERGNGVAIMQTLSDACLYLHGAESPTIVQTYVPGLEYGVFYERSPDAAKGKITGITLKGQTVVTGDGVSTLEHLILSDARAVCLAPLFLEMHRAHLTTVPAKDQRFVLNQLGTHSRGSLFLDANHLWAEALESSIDAASQHFAGFHLGRYDVRVPDEASFCAGRDWKIVELNGVASEPTHMYDPKHSVFYAWKILAGQWSRAYRFGALNRDLGHTPFSLKALMRRLRARANLNP